MASLILLRNTLLASQHAAPYCFALMRSMSTKVKEVHSREDIISPQNRFMDGYREYLDAVSAKAEEIDAAMDNLKDVYAKQRALQLDGWPEESEDTINELFEHSANREKELEVHIQDLKAMLADSNRIFAVDAPDGEPDANEKEDIVDINHWIDEAKMYEDKTLVDERQLMEELKKDGNRFLAVNAPDGESDGHFVEEQIEIENIIKDAAVHEDKETIEMTHYVDKEIRKDRAKGPEHDWEI